MKNKQLIKIFALATLIVGLGGLSATLTKAKNTNTNTNTIETTSEDSSTENEQITTNENNIKEDSKDISEVSNKKSSNSTNNKATDKKTNSEKETEFNNISNANTENNSNNENTSSTKTSTEQSENDNLNSNEVLKSEKKIAGFITNIYEKDGELYIDFDEAQFYLGKEAQKEYVKDGFSLDDAHYEWGNDYYIRNNSKSIKTYKISKDASLKLCTFTVHPNYLDEGLNSAETIPVSVDTFKDYVNSNKNKAYDTKFDRALLFWLDLNNDDIVTQAEMQFTP